MARPPHPLKRAIRRFSDLIRKHLGEGKRPFSEEESALLADPLVGRLLRRARAHVYRLQEHLQERGVQFDQVGTGPLYEGWNCELEQRRWWLGLWLDSWAATGESPVVLQLLGLEHSDQRPSPEGLPEHVPYVALRSKGRLLPLLLRAQVDPDELAIEHAEQVIRYMRAFPESGLRTATQVAGEEGRVA